jgi:hypothetical protein
VHQCTLHRFTHATQHEALTRTRTVLSLVSDNRKVTQLNLLPLDRLRLTGSDVAGHFNGTQRPRHRHSERFLAGPIPWPWIEAAMRLQGRVWHVATIIWHLASLNKRNRVRMEYKLARAAGMDRHTVRRALEKLEQAELVHVDRRRGRSPVVTILDLATTNSGERKAPEKVSAFQA